MGAARRWKLLPFRSPLPSPAAAASKPRYRSPDVHSAPSPSRKEEVPREFLCPILGAPMADPVILPSGRTYERACVRDCAELGLTLPQDGGGGMPGDAVTGGGVAAVAAAAVVAIPNDAVRAAVRTWCARSGCAPPVAPSPEEAREAVLRVAPARSASNLSCSTSRLSAASTSSSSSSSGGSSTEMTTAEVEVVRVKEAAKEIEEADHPARVAETEEEALARAVEAGDVAAVEVAMSALRRATREGAERRRALCAPRLLASLRRVLLSSRHAPAARADAAAALANLAVEPENRVPVVRAGVVPALVDAVASPAAFPPEAREHAVGALSGLALHEANRAAVGVLGAVPPLLAVLAARDGFAPSPRARLDAGTALYHLSLAAVNRSKLARAPGGARALLAVASDGAEPAPVRTLALMVVCNVAACAEGRAALMDAGAVATVSAILSDDARVSHIQQWCVAALYGMSGGSARFRGLARAAGADRPLTLIAEQANNPGVHKEMTQTLLRVIFCVSDNDDGDTSDREGNSGSSSFPSARPQRRRAASWAAPPASTPPSTQQWRSVCID